MDHHEQDAITYYYVFGVGSLTANISLTIYICAPEDKPHMNHSRSMVVRATALASLKGNLPMPQHCSARLRTTLNVFQMLFLAKLAIPRKLPRNPLNWFSKLVQTYPDRVPGVKYHISVFASILASHTVVLSYGK